MSGCVCARAREEIGQPSTFRLTRRAEALAMRSPSNFALESGIKNSAAESEQVLVRLRMQAARGASDGGHEKNRVVVI